MNISRKFPVGRFIILVFATLMLMGFQMLVSFKDGIRFSKKSGFYDDTISLKLTSNRFWDMGATEIRYTLDGDEPGRSGEVYDGELVLEKKDEVNLYTVTAAICNRDGGGCRKSSVGTYVIGDYVKDEVGLDIVSITSPWENLYNEKTGIFVEGDNEEGALPNYLQRTEEWIRDANVVILRPGEGEVLDQKLGIQVSGGTSAMMDVKSLKLIGNKKDYEEFVFDFGKDSTIKRYGSMRLRSGSQDMETGNIRSAVASRLAEESDFEGASATKRVVVYLNGDFYGIFDAQQNFSDSFLAKKFDLEDDNAIEKYKGSDRKVFEAAKVGELFEADLNDEKARKKLENKVDMDDYLKYFAIEILWNNTDWPMNSFEAWRYTGNKERKNKYSDGRWRFLIYDTDLIYYPESGPIFFEGVAGDQLEALMESKYRGENSTFRPVMHSKYYREKFVGILEELMEGAFRTDNVLAIIDEERERIAKAEALYYTEEECRAWEAQIMAMREVAKERNEVVREDLERYFGDVE